MHQTSLATAPVPTFLTRLALVGGLAVTLGLGGCGSGGNGSASGVDAGGGGAYLVGMQHGKLVDVYGLRTIAGSQVIELFQTDVIVGIDIQDERDSGSNKTDEEILFDFISANPDTLQPRLLITREIGSPEFETAVASLDKNVRSISPNQFGRNSEVAPYSVVPRNAALRLVFSSRLSITDDFFYAKDANGKITGFKNAEAVQLLKIVGDPNDKKFEGDFQVIDTRITVRGKTIIIDPVLLGTEGLIYGSRNTASGMPESPDQKGANIRLAIALDGALKIGGLAKDPVGTIRGRNNRGFQSIVRDFRSGNAADNSADLARGFIRDSEPPRVIGEMLMYLESVEPVNERTKLITIYKNRIDHEIDRGDLIRLQIPTSGTPIASLEVLQDPSDDRGKPGVQRVRVLVRPVIGPNNEDVLENLDPSNDPNFPVGAGTKREEFLRKFAPRAVLIAEYTHRRIRPVPVGNSNYYGDDPRNFLGFNPTPLPADSGVVIANENVSPFAGAIVRFSKPIDMATLIALDTVFFATRNVLDKVEIAKFVKARKIDESLFNVEKFKTPHLIHSRIFDENGSQTAIRVQPTMGFFLDSAMRKAAGEDKSKPFEDRRFHYYLHLVGGPNGVADLSGNPLDFQAQPIGNLEVVDNVVMAFSLDTRNRPGTTDPWFEDNIVYYVVRRFASADEDEKPNLFLKSEVTPPGGDTPAAGWRSDDFFGPVAYLPTGELIARPAARTTQIVDNVNQIPAPPQTSNLRWCPITGPTAFASATQIVFQTAGTPFGQPIQNPLNPYGCRLQTVWREIDMSLSRTDPLDFNLDVEQMYWAPFAGNAITFDEFDRVSLYLGHSEFRPESCVASGSAFPSMPQSGLFNFFHANYAANRFTTGAFERKPQEHPAYLDAVLSINAKDAILEPRGVNRFLPLPKFTDATKGTTLDNPLFVWRDELEIVQGGANGTNGSQSNPYPYLLSPWLGGKGNRVIGSGKNITFVDGGWHNANNRRLTNGASEFITGGCVGTIALPLLADFWTYPDSPELPKGDPFVASGINGWQISLAVTSAPTPYFRAYSAGRGGGAPIRIGPSHRNWSQAAGGYTPTGGTTPGRDNSVYWIMADFLKRTAVVTSGFVEITNPHRMTNAATDDPRLRPFTKPDHLPNFVYDFEPPLRSLPAGTTVVTEFRGASALDNPSAFWPVVGNNRTNTTNFPLDPLKAGDAHIKHYDNRSNRNWWTYLYNHTVTTYTEEPNDLAKTEYTNKFSGPNESFQAKDVRYFNWRFIMKNNVEADPPVSPKIESFAVSYRLNKQQ
jgi:hypothetical protein